MKKKIVTILAITGLCFGMTMNAAAAEHTYSTTIRTGSGGYEVTDEYVERSSEIYYYDNGSIDSPEGEIIVIDNETYRYDGKNWYHYNEETRTWTIVDDPTIEGGVNTHTDVNKKKTNTPSSTSPKTGMPMDYTLYAGAALVLAGSAIVLKKREA